MRTSYLQCGGCSKFINKLSASCPFCYRSCKEEKNEAPAISVFASGYYENIDLEPIYIRDRAQLRSETRRRGQVSPYVE